MRNAIRGITKGERSVIMIAFTLGVVMSAVLAISVASAGTIGDPWVFGFVVAAVVISWLPFGFMVHEAQHNVDGWHYEAGCYDRWIDFHNVELHLFVDKRPNTKHAYRVTIIADDFVQPFDGEYLPVIVSEYDDYGTLNNVLSTAEAEALRLIATSLSPF